MDVISSYSFSFSCVCVCCVSYFNNLIRNTLMLFSMLLESSKKCQFMYKMLVEFIYLFFVHFSCKKTIFLFHLFICISYTSLFHFFYMNKLKFLPFYSTSSKCNTWMESLSKNKKKKHIKYILNLEFFFIHFSFLSISSFHD